MLLYTTYCSFFCIIFSPLLCLVVWCVLLLLCLHHHHNKTHRYHNAIPLSLLLRCSLQLLADSSTITIWEGETKQCDENDDDLLSLSAAAAVHRIIIIGVFLFSLPSPRTPGVVLLSCSYMTCSHHTYCLSSRLFSTKHNTAQHNTPLLFSVAVHIREKGVVLGERGERAKKKRESTMQRIFSFPGRPHGLLGPCFETGREMTPIVVLLFFVWCCLSHDEIVVVKRQHNTTARCYYYDSKKTHTTTTTDRQTDTDYYLLLCCDDGR